MIKKLTQFFKDEDGATAVEYGVMVALIAAVIIATVATLGGQTDSAFQKATDELTNHANLPAAQ